MTTTRCSLNVPLCRHPRYWESDVSNGGKDAGWKNDTCTKGTVKELMWPHPYKGVTGHMVRRIEQIRRNVQANVATLWDGGYKKNRGWQLRTEAKKSPLPTPSTLGLILPPLFTPNARKGEQIRAVKPTRVRKPNFLISSPRLHGLRPRMGVFCKRGQVEEIELAAAC